MIKEPRCRQRGCKFFIGVKGEDEKDQRVVCDAFPEAIPNEIAYGNNLHLDKFTGDHGIQYEPKEDPDL